jgi:WD40 repeat protein
MAVVDVIHVPGGHRMMTSSMDGSLRVWDLQSGKQIGNDWRDGGGRVYVVGLSLGGKTVASGSDDGAVRLWDVDTGKCWKSDKLAPKPEERSGVLLSSSISC